MAVIPQLLALHVLTHSTRDCVNRQFHSCYLCINDTLLATVSTGSFTAVTSALTHTTCESVNRQFDSC